MPEGLDANDEMSVGRAQPRRATVAHAGHARRAMATGTCGAARRAAVENNELLTSQMVHDGQAGQCADAFVAARRRKSGGRRLVASLGLLVAVSSLSGSLIAGSAALSAAPAQTPTAGVARDVSASRDADRPAPTTSTSATPAAASSDLTVEMPTPAALDEVAAKALEERKTAKTDPATEAATPAAAPLPTVAENTAPGQIPAASVEEAMARAESMTGNWGYQNMCLSLVATFYGYTSAGEEGAQQSAATVSAAGQMHTDLTNIPVGALIWYDGTPIGNPFGHVAMYAGNGMVYSNGAPTGVGLIPLREPADGWGEPIIGWSSVWLPAATK